MIICINGVKDTYSGAFSSLLYNYHICIVTASGLVAFNKNYCII